MGVLFVSSKSYFRTVFSIAVQRAKIVFSEKTELRERVIMMPT